VTLDLNGYTISGSESTADNRRVFAVDGTMNFTICDTRGGGLIDGHNVLRQQNNSGAFLRVSDIGATFTLKGGTIANFSAEGYGGAIDTVGMVRIEGGMITNCCAQHGGGVHGFASSTVTMSVTPRLFSVSMAAILRPYPSDRRSGM